MKKYLNLVLFLAVLAGIVWVFSGSVQSADLPAVLLGNVSSIRSGDVMRVTDSQSGVNCYIYQGRFDGVTMSCVGSTYEMQVK